MKKKDRSETEYLKGKIRKLESQVKTLQRELARYRKYERVDVDGEVELVKPKNPKKRQCPQCREGKLEIADLMGVRKIEKCTECDYRKTYGQRTKKNDDQSD